MVHLRIKILVLGKFDTIWQFKRNFSFRKEMQTLTITFVNVLCNLYELTSGEGPGGSMS